MKDLIKEIHDSACNCGAAIRIGGKKRRPVRRPKK